MVDVFYVILFVHSTNIAYICDQCNYNGDRCIICNGKGVSIAYYCINCVIMEKDRDGCPKIIQQEARRSIID